MSGEQHEEFEQQAIFIESIEPRKIVLTYTLEEIVDKSNEGPCWICGQEHQIESSEQRRRDEGFRSLTESSPVDGETLTFEGLAAGERKTKGRHAIELTSEQVRIIMLALGVFTDRSIEFMNMIIDIDKKVNEEVSEATLDFVRMALRERIEIREITSELVGALGSDQTKDEEDD